MSRTSCSASSIPSTGRPIAIGVKRYRVEPYAVAADIYSAPGTCGRGGWTWYTGAAGWMYRVTLEHILGIKREGEWLRIEPCVPAGWPGYKVTLRIEGAEYAIEVDNSGRAGMRCRLSRR